MKNARGFLKWKSQMAEKIDTKYDLISLQKNFTYVVYICTPPNDANIPVIIQKEWKNM